MRYKVKIKKLPQARTGYQVQGSLANDVPAFGGADYDSYIGTPNLKASRYIKAVPREEANLEAEGGETVYGDLNGDSIPEHKIIKGPRHTQGGVPLKLPDDSFIFSDTRSMKINNPDILQMFNKAPKKQKGKSGFTPAELAKQYDIESYRKILQDPNSDAVDKKTAELMIRNYNMKLGALALAQESKKGFPQGIPVMAQPYMEASGIKPEQILPPELPEPEAPGQEEMMMRYGGMQRAKKGLAVDEPCPDGFVYDPIYGCIPESEKYLKNYTPEQIQKHFRDAQKTGRYEQDLYDNLLKENPDYFNKPVDDFMIQMYKDNNVPIIQFDNGTYGVDYLNLNPDQRDQKNIIDKNYIHQLTDFYNKAGYSPNEWLDEIKQRQNPNKYQDERNLERDIKFNKSLDDYQQQYEMNMQDCPCRKTVQTPEGIFVEECVPCKDLQMAAYGMEMGGYNFPYDLPMAEYGMPMGANPMNYMGRTKHWYEEGGELSQYAPGGEPPKDGVILKRSDYATQADYEKALKLWYYKNGKAGTKLYVQQTDGQYKPINFKYSAPAAATGTIEAGWGSGDRSAKIAGQYAAIEAALKDPVTAKLFVDATREVIQNQESYRSKDRKNPDGTIKKGVIGKGYGKLNANDPKSPNYLTDEDIIKNFTEHQKRNLMISAQGYESYLFTDASGKLRPFDSTGDGKADNMGFKDVIMKTNNPKTGKPYTEAEAKAEFDRFGKEGVKTLDDAFTKIGLPLPAVTAGSGSTDEKKALLQQATFQGYNKLYNDLQAGKITDENQILGLLNFRGNLQRGFEDENVAGTNNISPIDAFYTNTTAGQISAYENLGFEEGTIPCPCTGEDGKPVQPDAEGNCPCEEDCPCGKDENGNCKECEEGEIPKAPPANWWLQDTIKTTGAFGDLMGLDKQMPWSPRVDLEEPRPTFLDPTRELAQQSEQANIATQSLAQFVGPQALSARASSIQGTGAKQAADTLSRFNNANVNIADQFEFKSTDIRNQEALANQASQQKLYDSNVIANQQYSNAKLAMRNQLRNYYTDALTNKGKTAALNNLYPQYAVLPETGGMPAFKGGKQLKPEVSKSSQDYFDEIKQQYPDLDDKTAYQMAKDRAGQQDASAGVDPQKVLEMQYNLKKGGPVYVMGDNVFPFMFY